MPQRINYADMTDDYGRYWTLICFRYGADRKESRGRLGSDYCFQLEPFLLFTLFSSSIFSMSCIEW
jgi:hypothetical protein